MKRIVSVRMPSGLAAQLRQLAQDNNYLDVSELVRSIVRTKATHYASRSAQEARRIIAGIEKELDTRTHQNDESALITGLRNLLEEYRK